MPAKVKVRILAGRNLPVMDKSSDASDAFVEVKLGNTTYKTEVYRRSLNPFWNSEWFRFEVSDQELQDEPLQIRVMDYDTYSANDAIGKVYINLNPLLVNPGRSMSGWLPIYDTLHGIRGEINCMVKVNLFADNNRYRHSSCGVRFFFSDIPNGYKCDAILGFVDELLVNDDPEYQWIDKIRTPRASNEARQTLFTKLSGEVQRKLGLKAEIFGGNAVIGYQLSFDLEGGSGIVGRGIGTAVVLSKIGFPYEGIISPLHMNNQYSSYMLCASNRVPEHQYGYHDRFSRQSLTIQRREKADRGLIHSSSADYFFENPNRRRFLSSTKPYSISKVESEDEDDDSKYLDCEKVLNDSDSDLDIHELTARANLPLSNSSYSLSQRVKNFSRFSKPLIAHDSLDTKNSIEHSESQRLSTRFILKKLLSTNENITQKITVVTRPLTSSSGLFKMPFLRRQQQQFNNAHKQGIQSVDVSDSIINGREKDDALKDTQSILRTTSEDIPPALSSKQKSILQLSSKATNSRPVTNQLEVAQVSSSSTGTSKRRRDRSLSASVDETLPIIEEKLDDDDHPQQKTVIRQPNTKTNQANKFRQMTRTKEIDLNDESESSGNIKPKGFTCLSSAEDEDTHEINTNAASSATNLSISNPDSNIKNRSDSILSSSSPSTSPLTDETIKACNNTQVPKQLNLDDCNVASGSKYNKQLTKSDTDVSQQLSLDTQPYANINSSVDTLVAPRDSFSRVDSSFDQVNNTKQSSPTKSQRQPSQKSLDNRLNQTNSGANNFVLSVRAVKAQQHLLQNMVKHQNQNLLTSSSLRAKNAFMYPNRVHQSEYPFVTLKRFPIDTIQSIGGVVSVHSVKLLDHIINDEESETRDIWWTEVRKEIRSHTKALNCNTILGYTETSKVLGDVCVLSAFGTAAILRSSDGGRSMNCRQFKDEQAINQSSLGGPAQILQNLKVSCQSNSPSPIPSQYIERLPTPQADPNLVATGAISKGSTGIDEPEKKFNHHQLDQQDSIGNDNTQELDCSFCHTSLVCAESISTLPSCTICKSSKVPDILLLTIEPPKNLNIASTGTLVQARVCRMKRDSHGEVSAKEIGDALPFLEYELHRQLFGKLKFKGMNCLFNLCIDISIGENMITGIATGTGCFVLGLPTPNPPQISAGKGIKTSKLNEIKSLVALSAQKNRNNLGLQYIESQLTLYHEKLQQQQQQSKSSPLDPLDENSSMQTVAGENTIPNRSYRDINQENKREVSSSSPTDSINHEAGTSNITNQENLQLSQESLSNGKKRLTSSKHSRNLRYHHSHHHNRRHQRLLNSDQVLLDGNHLTPAENLVNLLSGDSNIVLEVDDNEDADIIALLIDTDIPEGYLVCNSESIPSIQQSSIASINMFTHVMRAKLVSLDQFAQQFDWILQSLFVKLRRSLPCCLTNISFLVDIPETHVIQISVTGCLLGLINPADAKAKKFLRQGTAHDDSSSTQSSLSAASTSPSSSSSTTSSQSVNTLGKSSSLSSISETEDINNSRPKPEDLKPQPGPSVVPSEVTGNKVELKATTSKPTSSTSLSKQLSKSNLAALFLRHSSSSSGSNKKRTATDEVASSIDTIEMRRITKNEIIQNSQMNETSASTFADRTVNSSIDISSLSYIPGAKEYHYLGNLAFSFVRETNSVRENGGLNGFIHCFLMEVYAIVRAHVSALGGNAFLSFRLQQSCIFYHSNKNQAQCLISVAGDAVQVTL